MLEVTMCDNCIHVNVCGKKDKYKKHVEALGKVCVSPSDNMIMYAKDDADILVCLKCTHYGKYNPISVK